MTAIRTMGLARDLPPNAGVTESACGCSVRLPVAGFAQDELEVEVSDHTITVRGDEKRTRADDRAFLLHERLEESFKLPADADTTVDCVEASDPARVLRAEGDRIADPGGSAGSARRARVAAMPALV